MASQIGGVLALRSVGEVFGRSWFGFGRWERS